jgi:hypothetical protein
MVAGGCERMAILVKSPTSISAAVTTVSIHHPSLHRTTHPTKQHKWHYLDGCWQQRADGHVCGATPAAHAASPAVANFGH